MFKKALLLGALAILGDAAPLYRRANSTAPSLRDFCDVSNIQDAIPSNGTLNGIDILPDSVTASIVRTPGNLTSSYGSLNSTNSTSSSGSGSSSYNYCNVSLQYVHTGTDYLVTLVYAFPDPQDFKNRFYSAGGSGYLLNTDATGGLPYGAVSGATDAGYDSLDGVSFDEIVLFGNGSLDWEATFMFGYQALGELTIVGKELTRNLYQVDDGQKIYTYFEGCSEGGREAMSQVQRYGEEYDGVIAGAPAFRLALERVGHVAPALYEYVEDYIPEPCALSTIVNLTIEACDDLDGREDGVIGRTDLCLLQFNLSSLIGESYNCDASTITPLGFGFSNSSNSSITGSSHYNTSTAGSPSYAVPAQSGTISEEDVLIAQKVWDGLHNNDGERAYVGWQIGSELSDAEPTYNNDTDDWEINIPSTGGEWITKFIELIDLDNLEDFDGADYDTAVEWMNTGLVRFWDSLQTVYPDLSTFHESGGKLLHYHGESDPSVPAASSVLYWQSVKKSLYGNLTLQNQIKALDDWYQLYLIPGAGHCGANSLQPGPYPQTNMEIIIDWVENDHTPAGLNSTVTSGKFSGEEQLLCKFPQRPVWQGSNSSSFDCEFDEDAYQTWNYTFPAFDLPIW